jgi:hypothetical protein
MDLIQSLKANSRSAGTELPIHYGNRILVTSFLSARDISRETKKKRKRTVRRPRSRRMENIKLELR